METNVEHVDEKYISHLDKLLNVMLFVVCPGKVGKNFKWRKISKLFICYIICHASCLLITGSYCYSKWNEISLSSLTEALATFMIFFRTSFYLMIFATHHLKFTNQFKTLVATRLAMKENENQGKLILRYCKTEFIIAVAYAFAVASGAVFNLTACIIFFPNAYHLPLKFYILWFPLNENFIFNWLINYCFQAFIITLETLFLIAYCSLTMFLMNQSSLEIEAALINVRELDDTLSTDAPQNHPEQVQIIAKNITKVIESTESVVKWQKQVQSLLKFSFLADFTLLSSIVCMWIFAVIENFSDSFSAFVSLCVMLNQLFIYCWMGSRFQTRISNLATALYNTNWDRMIPSHRSELKTVLQMTQNVKGFDGVFKTVNLATFQQIIEFSYSLLALLQSRR